MRNTLLIICLALSMSCIEKNKAPVPIEKKESIPLKIDTIQRVEEIKDNVIKEDVIEKKVEHKPKEIVTAKPKERPVEKPTSPKKNKVIKEIKQPKSIDLSKVKPDYSDPKTTKNPSIPKKVEEAEKKTEIAFRRNFFSFGEIAEGDTVAFKFSFTNIGDHPLLIKSATATCGCTHPTFSFLPVAPGEQGEIGGLYVSTGKKGPQNPMVQVTANTFPEEAHKLYLDGTVVPAQEVKSEKSDTSKIED